ncbi:MAG TPA: hypothetical protein VMT34_13095 [Aggregatilineales bacterium]|nr:hypothetical protein [Aggregatilineales bacterium]
MNFIERTTQKVRQGKWEELDEIDKKFNAVEARFGFPAKKRYRCVAGNHDGNTLVIERQWASLATMEATYEKIFADSTYQQLVKEVDSVIESNQMELYTPLP